MELQHLEAELLQLLLHCIGRSQLRGLCSWSGASWAPSTGDATAGGHAGDIRYLIYLAWELLRTQRAEFKNVAEERGVLMRLPLHINLEWIAIKGRGGKGRTKWSSEKQGCC